MKRFCAPNLSTTVWLARGLLGLKLLLGAVLCGGESPWAAGLLAAAGLFVLFEALRGCCLARACGINTRL